MALLRDHDVVGTERALPVTCTRLISQGSLVHFFMTFSSALLNSVTEAEKSSMNLFFSGSTCPSVWKRNDGLPCISVMAADWASLRPPSSSSFCATVTASEVPLAHDRASAHFPTNGSDLVIVHLQVEYHILGKVVLGAMCPGT